ncbi:MAG: type II secretion system F family protein [Candidatus Diapherotrites archaeon]|nr:type II secretion system F family protein [Candidatus Diapherotrites archaeon]
MAFYRRFGMLFPQKIREAFKKELEYVGMETPEANLLGFIFTFGLVISIAITANAYVFLNTGIWLALAIFAVLFVVFGAGIYLWLNMIAENRGKFVQRILPDVLQLVSSNLKSGLTTEKALLASARPEFGVFAKELKLASAKVLAGERIEEALTEITYKIKNRSLERTMWLMVQGIRSGGEVADLLSQLSEDLREENALQDETQAEVSMYILLIFIAAAIGAPILFGVSSYIVGVLSEQTEQFIITPEELEDITSRSPVGKFLGVPQISISPEFATMFSLLALLVTCTFASLIMGVINTGKEKNGIKYLPAILIVGVSLFFIIRMVLEMVLGNIGTMM